MLITNSSYSFPHETHIAKAKLDSAGIPEFLADEHTIGIQWFYSNALGGVKLQVPRSFEDEARQLSESDSSAQPVKEQGQDKDLCPVCGGEETALLVRGRRINFHMMAASLVPVWPFKRHIKCLSCAETRDYKT